MGFGEGTHRLLHLGNAKNRTQTSSTSQRRSFPTLNPASFRQMIQFDTIWLEVFFLGGWSNLIQFDPSCNFKTWIILSFFLRGDEHIIPTHPSLAFGASDFVGGFSAQFFVGTQNFATTPDIQIQNLSWWLLSQQMQIKTPKSSFSTVAMYGSKILLTKPV